MALTDVQLMVRIKRGDREAFGVLVRRYQTPLVNFFYRCLWDRDQAEDFAQDVFLKVYAARQSYTVKSSFKTFLFRIAKNHWIDYLRSHGKREKPLSLYRGAEDSQQISLEDSFAEKPSDVSSMVRDEQMAELRRAIDSLPEEQKVVFILSELQGMKYRDIAESLSAPLGTIKSRMHLAVAKLREMLSKNYHPGQQAPKTEGDVAGKEEDR